MFEQVPVDPAIAQLRHSPVQLLLQQTPSTQKPDLHSSPLAQVEPSSLRPHMPSSHLRVGMQWLSAAHELKQSVPVPLQT